MDFIIMIFIYLFVLVVILISVAFTTLMERKILGYVQFRKGPNKVNFLGILQPMGDGIKLFFKFGINLNMIEFGYLFMPMGMLFLMILLWMLMYLGSSMGSLLYGMLFIIMILSMGVYPILLGSWFSGSLYSMLASIRSVAQMVSYEVSFIMILMLIIYMINSLNMNQYEFSNYNIIFLFSFIMLIFLSSLVELNRTPVDLIEGESELVSGFNTEYFSIDFIMIFLGEYGMIMFMGGLMSMIMGFNSFSAMWMVFMVFYVYLILLIRGVLPRMRYDLVMELCWISILGVSIGYLFLVMMISKFFYI